MTNHHTLVLSLQTIKRLATYSTKFVTTGQIRSDGFYDVPTEYNVANRIRQFGEAGETDDNIVNRFLDQVSSKKTYIEN